MNTEKSKLIPSESPSTLLLSPSYLQSRIQGIRTPVSSAFYISRLSEGDDLSSSRAECIMCQSVRWYICDPAVLDPVHFWRQEEWTCSLVWHAWSLGEMGWTEWALGSPWSSSSGDIRTVHSHGSDAPWGHRDTWFCSSPCSLLNFHWGLWTWAVHNSRDLLKGKSSPVLENKQNCLGFVAVRRLRNIILFSLF